MPLQRLGPYRIDCALGHGGMGSVYAGVHEQTGERAAIKVLAEGLSTDARFRERFQGEVETLKKLRHENIVTLRGYGEADGQMFFVMELVDGQSLESDLREGRRFTWREVVDITVQICAALKHAHDHGVIHRDLKPANLLRTPEGKVKLTDFGIAKFFGSSGLTTAGSMIGTPDYMAPEQTEGKPVTPRTDLYSLGSVMYALLTGKPPFSGATVLDVIQRVRFEEPRPLRLVTPQIPEALDEVVGQLLRKNPDERIATPQALSNLLQAMRHALASAGPTVVTPPPRPEAVGVTAEFTPPITGATQLPGQPLSTGERPTIDFAPDHPMPPPALPPAAPQITIDPSAATRNSTEVARAGTLPAARPSAASDHFTAVTEDDWRRERDSSEPRTFSRRDLAITGGMGVALVGIVLAFAIALWPPSADRVFQRIRELAPQGQVADDYETALRTFLQRFPDDPRAAEVATWRTEYLCVKLRGELQSTYRSLTDLERLYLLGMQAFDDQQWSDAETRFQAIVDGCRAGVFTPREQKLLEQSQTMLDRTRRQAAEK